MNKIAKDILNALLNNTVRTQRELAEVTGYSLGSVNRSVKTLQENGYIDEELNINEKAEHLADYLSPKKAIILAAGFGMRMVPINTQTPKGLVEINGEPLIERLIKQLHEVGVTDISVVVGFMKEQYEYLIDQYQVKLVVNPDYAEKNNLHSMNLVADKIENTYIMPCDIWCNENPFSKNELYSWYMVSDVCDFESEVIVNRKQQLVKVENNGNKMIGISYITIDDAQEIREKLCLLDGKKAYYDAFWESALYKDGRMVVEAKVVDSNNIFEINTYEQLRELDNQSNHLKSDAINIIKEALDVTEEDIVEITVLKKGMTNRSFLFTAKGTKYIMRIPGEGTDQMINRREEAAVYHKIADKDICDTINYINPNTGYKITEFLEGARVCDIDQIEDIKVCMQRLRRFHDMELEVGHRFDLFAKIDFYESLWNGTPSMYKDYAKTKKQVLSLQEFVESHCQKEILVHLDAVPDNFLFVPKEDGREEVRLIDWEYASMQDPHVDIAMFAIYALYNREQTDMLIDQYFTEGCDPIIRIKIYAYMAIAGLLWSNWCEYKAQLGVEFGEYSLRQYRYAKEYYAIVEEELAQLKEL